MGSCSWAVWGQKMCALKSLMSQVLSNTPVKVFLGTKTYGALSPQSFVRGSSYAPPPAPYSAAYDTTFPKLYMTCNSFTCSRLFVSFNFWYFKKNFINKLFLWPLDNVHFIANNVYIQVSQLFPGCNILLTFRVQKHVPFCIKKLLHFGLMLHFSLMLHFRKLLLFAA